MKPSITIPRLNLDNILQHQPQNNQHPPPPKAPSSSPLSSHGSPSTSASSKKSPGLRNVSFPYLQGTLIGTGNFGDVYFGMNAISGECIAIKQIQRIHGSKKHNLALQTFQREVDVVCKLRHPHVVGYLGIGELILVDLLEMSCHVKCHVMSASTTNQPA